MGSFCRTGYRLPPPRGGLPHLPSDWAPYPTCHPLGQMGSFCRIRLPRSSPAFTVCVCGAPSQSVPRRGLGRRWVHSRPPAPHPGNGFVVHRTWAVTSPSLRPTSGPAPAQGCVAQKGRAPRPDASPSRGIPATSLRPNGFVLQNRGSSTSTGLPTGARFFRLPPPSANSPLAGLPSARGNGFVLQKPPSRPHSCLHLPNPPPPVPRRGPGGGRRTRGRSLGRWPWREPCRSAGCPATALPALGGPR